MSRFPLRTGSRPFRWLAAAGALGLVLADCGGERYVAEREGGDSTSSAPDTSASGGELAVQPADAPHVLAAVRTPGARVTLVNVWATWCGPCREEFPDLVRFQRDYRDRGVRVMFVSTDFEDELGQVRRFLARQGVNEVTWIKSGDDMAFINGLHPEWTGALPATLVYDGKGRLRAFWEGAADYEKFEKEVRKVLDGSSPS